MSPKKSKDVNAGCIAKAWGITYDNRAVSPAFERGTLTEVSHLQSIRMGRIYQVRVVNGVEQMRYI